MLKSVGPFLLTMAAFYIPMHCAYIIYGYENFNYVAILISVLVFLVSCIERKIYEWDFGKISKEEEDEYLDIVTQHNNYLLSVFLATHFVSVLISYYKTPATIGEWTLPTGIMFFIYFCALMQREKTLLIIYLYENAPKIYLQQLEENVNRNV